MGKKDARNQTLERLHERRKQVVRLHKKGMKIMQIVPLLIRPSNSIKQHI